MRALVAGILMAVVFGAEARIWTSSEGKTVEAELVRVEYGNAYLRPAGKTKLYPFLITNLSSEDQDYIEQFLKDEEDRLKERRKEQRKLKWHTDFPQAQAEAKELEMPILFLYTAPEWCGWCRVLDNNILETAEFKK
ncbi:MAG: thioredoxin family protein, partial [Kiritimatiellaceae bacterium]|nr:thioredoxin family protein [Kiritimatiellaceae bacterium]